MQDEVRLGEITLDLVGCAKDFGLSTKCNRKPLDGDKQGSREVIRFSFCTGLSGEDKEWTMGRAARRQAGNVGNFD